MAAVTKPAMLVWTNLDCASWLNMRSPKLASSMRMVSGLNQAPWGSCMKPLATRIQTAERFEPKATRKVTVRCCALLSRSQPKTIKPTKVDSMKKAIRPSIASGAPKISPTKPE